MWQKHSPVKLLLLRQDKYNLCIVLSLVMCVMNNRGPRPMVKKQAKVTARYFKTFINVCEASVNQAFCRGLLYKQSDSTIRTALLDSKVESNWLALSCAPFTHLLNYFPILNTVGDFYDTKSYFSKGQTSACTIKF